MKDHVIENVGSHQDIQKLFSDLEHRFTEELKSILHNVNTDSNEDLNIDLLDECELDTSAINTMIFINNNVACDTAIPIIEKTDDSFPPLPERDRAETVQIEPELQTQKEHSWAAVTKRKSSKASKINLQISEHIQSIKNKFEILSSNKEKCIPTREVKTTKTSQGSPVTSPKLILLEKEGSLLKTSTTTSIAFSVDEGLDTSHGLAQLIEARYHVTDVLHAQMKRPGQVGVARCGQRYLLSVVTKRQSNEQPSMQTVQRALESLKKCCVLLGIRELAVPQFSVAGTPWCEVKRHIRQVFADLDITITVYTRRNYFLPDLQNQENNKSVLNVRIKNSLQNLNDSKQDVPIFDPKDDLIKLKQIEPTEKRDKMKRSVTREIEEEINTNSRRVEDLNISLNIKNLKWTDFLKNPLKYVNHKKNERLSKTWAS